MTAIADAELQKLFNKFALAYARAAVEADIEPDNAYDWGSSEARDAFCAALNERLEAADALDIAVWKLNGVGCVGIPVKTLREIEAAHTAYRQSKERT